MSKTIFVLIHGVEGLQEGYSDTDFTYYESYGEALVEQQTHVGSYLQYGYTLDEDKNSRCILSKGDLSVVVGIYRIDDYIDGTAFNWVLYEQLENLPSLRYLDKDNSIYAINFTVPDRQVMNDVYEIRSENIFGFDEMNDLEEIANFISTTQGFMLDVDGHITYYSPIKNIIS